MLYQNILSPHSLENVSGLWKLVPRHQLLALYHLMKSKILVKKDAFAVLQEMQSSRGQKMFSCTFEAFFSPVPSGTQPQISQVVSMCLTAFHYLNLLTTSFSLLLQWQLEELHFAHAHRIKCISYRLRRAQKSYQCHYFPLL